MKKVIASIMVLGLLSGLSNPDYTLDINKDKATENIADLTIYDNPAFTQTDINENFANYAEKDATLTLSPSTNAISFLDDEQVANVVGIVLEKETGKPVSDAKIFINDKEMVKTGSDGRFQITNLPNNEYNWKIISNGYQQAEYNHYSVHNLEGTDIFTFNLSKDMKINHDRNDCRKEDQQIPQYAENKNQDERATYSMSSVSNSIYFNYNGGNISRNRQRYIYTVVSSELYTADWYASKGLTSIQYTRLCKVQAMAANTFLEYCLKVYSNHPYDSYKICSSDHCQSYDETKVTTAAINATAEIFQTINGEKTTKIVLYKPTSSTYDYIWGAYFSSCNGNGTKTHNNQPALVAKACTDLTTGAGGHRYGVCQMGAASLAKAGQMSANDIVLYYYSGCKVVNAPLR